MSLGSNIKIVDSHHHLWDLSRGDYNWLTPDITELYQDFNHADYTTTIQNQNIEKSVLIQAADTDEETDYLLMLADKFEIFVGVVGWVNFESTPTSVINRLNILSKNKAFKGIRPMLQDIADIHWILNPDFTYIFEHLITLNLSFDALIRTEHLPVIYLLAKEHPKLKIVINHCAKPDIASAEFNLWAKGMTKFTALKNVYVKVSGLTLEANEYQQSAEYFKPYFDHIYQIFGAEHLMWGSDWPVLNLKSRYSYWMDISKQLIADFSINEQQAFWLGTATEFYQLDK